MKSVNEVGTMQNSMRKKDSSVGSRQPVLHELSQKQQQQARDRFALLQPCLVGEVSIAALARQHNLPLKTVQRWVYRYRKLGLVGLTHQTRADRGARRSLPQEGVLVIEGLALGVPRLSIAAIHRRISALAQEQQWPVPSYGQVYAIVQAMDPELVVFAQEGSKVYQERFDLLYLREAEAPNAWWQADHCWLNIWLLNAEGKFARPWLTIILDEYSRMVMGYRLSFERPAAYTTGLVLRQAILHKQDPAWPACGIPEHFYTDHGSDFTSNYLRDVGAELAMQLVFSQPGRPRGRGKVERFFRTVKQLFLPELPGTFTREPRNYRSARKRRKSRRPVSPARKRNAQLTLAEFDAQFRIWLVQTYHHRVHRTIQCTPFARWQSAKRLPRMPETVEQLDGLLVQGSKTCTIRTTGITFVNRRYFSLHFAGHIGKQVSIRYDPADLSTVAVYEWEGDRERFLCWAEYQGSEQPSISLKDIVTARNARRKMVRAQLREREQAVGQLLPAPVGRSEEVASPEQTPVTERSKARSIKPPVFLRDLPPELLPPRL